MTVGFVGPWCVRFFRINEELRVEVRLEEVVDVEDAYGG